MHDLSDAGPDTTAAPVLDPDEDGGPSNVDENGRLPVEARWHADMTFAMHLMYDRALEPFDGYTFAIYQKQVVGKGKDYRRLLRRVTKKFGIESWQVILIDPEDGIM